MQHHTAFVICHCLFDTCFSLAGTSSYLFGELANHLLEQPLQNPSGSAVHESLLHVNVASARGMHVWLAVEAARSLGCAITVLVPSTLVPSC